MHMHATILRPQYSYKYFWIFCCLRAGTLKIQVRDFLLQPYLMASARRRALSTT